MEQVHTVKKYRGYYTEYRSNPSDRAFFEEYKAQITLVNVNIRMYNFDDVQCTLIPSVAYGFVTGMNLQLC